MKKFATKALALVLVLLMVCGTLLTSCQKPQQDDPADDTPTDQTQNPDNQEGEDMSKYVTLSDKGLSLYNATYQTMLDRLHENGYAQTSLTGAYNGMFVRDASIQVMAHIAEGDMDAAMSILRYMATYHKAVDAEFALHIMNGLNADDTWDYVSKDEKPASVASTLTASNEDYSVPLYKINMPNNGCAQKVVVPFDNISELAFYLDISGDEGEIVVSIGTKEGDASIGRTTCDIADLGSGKGWYNIRFDEPVAVEAGKEYVISLWAEDATGNIVSYGKTSGGSGFNYDKPAFGGWAKNAQVIAYRILSNTSFVGSENAITQSFVAKGDVIHTAEVEILSGEKVKLHAAIVDAAGKQLATIEAETTGGTVCFDFGSVAITEGETYGLSVYAESGEAIWNGAPMPNIAYRTADTSKSALSETYSLRIYPEYSGSLTAAQVKVGGDVVAKQSMPGSLNGKFVTSAQLYLAAVGTPAADATFTVSLYKGTKLVSSVTRPVSALTDKIALYGFEFSLPADKLKNTEFYSVEVSASDAESVIWYGMNKKDFDQICSINGETQDAVLSYRAGISDVKPYSEKIQVDGHYMWMNAFAMFVLEAGEEYKDFINSIYDQMIAYTYYFVQNGYIHENGLVHNPNYEHSRKGRYWDGYDLITNCFTSEALHKMSMVAELYGDKDIATEFAALADGIADAVHTELVSEFDGKTIYTELIALDENGAIYRGFSFVSLAPIAADWYAMDEEIMANTYESYLAVGTQKYSGLDMLAVVVDIDENDQATYHGNHVIGKGLGWELYYLWKTGNTERLAEVLEFVDKRSNDIYPETWVLDGRLADSGNQEQASWILYEVARIIGKYQK